MTTKVKQAQIMAGEAQPSTNRSENVLDESVNLQKCLTEIHRQC